MGLVTALLCIAQPYLYCVWLQAWVGWTIPVRSLGSIYATYVLAALFLHRYYPTAAYVLRVIAAAGWAGGFAEFAYRSTALNSIPLIALSSLVGAVVGSIANLLDPFELLKNVESMVLTATAKVGRSVKRSGSGARARADGGEFAREDRQQSQQSAEWYAPSDDAWSVLGVPRYASEGQIRQAYRSLMKQYHPDRVHSLGPELRRLAEEKAKQINVAYETLCRR